MTQERNFRAWYIELSELSPEAPATEKRARGFAFEKVLKGLLASEGLEPRSSYKSAGEQIDGSLYLDGSFLLMEAKWHAMPVPTTNDSMRACRLSSYTPTRHSYLRVH